MALVKQSSGPKRQWFDWLARLVCISAILTLATAGIAGILGQRLGTLIITQQAAEKADQHRQDQRLSAALQAAKSQWGQKQAGLEKALQSAKLKIKAAQTANTKIRKQLVVLQKELAVLKKSGNGQMAESTGAGEKAPINAAAAEAQPQPPAGQQPAPAASSPETVDPEGTATATVEPASGDGATDAATDVAAAESVSQGSVVSQASAKKQSVSTTTPQQSSLLAVPDADPLASE